MTQRPLSLVSAIERFLNKSTDQLTETIAKLYESEVFVDSVTGDEIDLTIEDPEAQQLIEE